MSPPSIKLNLVNVFALGIVQVNSAGDTRIERVDRPQDFQWLFRISQPRANQGLFVSGTLSLGIARRCIPSARYNELVVVDLPILDFDPMCQRATRRLAQSNPLRGCRPGGGLPAIAGEGRKFTGLYLREEFIVEALHPMHDETGLQPACGRSAQG